MTSKNYIDFDAADNEGNGEPLTVKVSGKKYELPASPPALAMLKIRRIYSQLAEVMLKKEQGKLTKQDDEMLVELADSMHIEDMLGQLVGKELVDEWLDSGISDVKLKGIFRSLWNRYNSASGEDDGDGDGDVSPKVPANRAQKRSASRRKPSSSTGRASKPISVASTKSKSRKK